MSVRLRKWTNKEGKPQEHWVIDVKVQLPGKPLVRVRDASPVNTRRGAEAYERQVRQSILDGTWGKEPEKPTPTVEEFLPKFLVYAENNNKPSTLSNKRHVLRDHILPAFGKMALDEIGPADIETFKAAMRKKVAMSRHQKESPSKWAIKKRYGKPPKTLSDKTINNYLSVLRKLLNVAADWGVIKYVPRMKFFRTDKPPYDYLTFEEAQRLVDAADPQWRTIILLTLKSGLRQGELIGLQWSDIDLVQSRITVRRSIWHGIAGAPKSWHARTVAIPNSVVQALSAHKHLRGPWVFCNEDGSQLSKGQLDAPLLRALRRSGISRDMGFIGWHDLRHTYASHLAMKGVPLKVIQELLGHATIEMTMRYAHLSPEVKQEAVQLLDEPARPLPSGPAGAHTGHMGEKAT